MLRLVDTVDTVYETWIFLNNGSEQLTDIGRDNSCYLEAYIE
jgi:hypothetical protein